MLCARKGCLASFEWFGNADDPALLKLARERGWRLFEAAGWLCPKHQERLT